MKKEGLSLIKQKDVVRMKIPFPTISDKLAVQNHMYICCEDSVPNYSFLKCQTFKPQHIYSGQITHYVIENADPTRNPFRHTSMIDCDKVFTSVSCHYDDRMKTTVRSDVCQDLYDSALSELQIDGYSAHALNEDELVTLNPSMITRIV